MFKPLARNKHGCFNYKDEIIVFGGFGPRAANQFADSSEINDDGQGTIKSGFNGRILSRFQRTNSVKFHGVLIS